jgi:phosphate transport system substrate-binding protein
VALALAAAVTGCSADSGSPPQAAAAVRLTGAGSTFDAPFFTAAFPAYQHANPGVAVSYSAVGSSAGITRFTAGQVSFGATDVPATAAGLAGARGGAAVQVPVDLGAVVIAYNLPGAPRLKLTGPVVARIFLGQVSRWNDPAITALNPGTSLPDAPVTVVHRADGSGTTYIFSDYLSKASPAWAAQVGTGRSLHWPAGQGATGNDGVASALVRITYSVGYVENSWAFAGPLLAVAAIANQAGNYVTPTAASVTAAAAAKPGITATDFSIVNEPGAGAYPICGYSWALVSARQPSQPAGQALVALLSWLTHAGQSYAAALGYVPLPPAVQQLATTTLAHVTGPAGAPLTS